MLTEDSTGPQGTGGPPALEAADPPKSKARRKRRPWVVVFVLVIAGLTVLLVLERRKQGPVAVVKATNTSPGVSSPQPSHEKAASACTSMRSVQSRRYKQ